MCKKYPLIKGETKEQNKYPKNIGKRGVKSILQCKEKTKKQQVKIIKYPLKNKSKNVKKLVQ